MIKFLVLAVIATACVVTFAQTKPDAADDRWYWELAQSLDLNDARQTARRLDEERDQHARFREHVDQLLARLEAGSLSLAEAADDCLRAAREHHPLYLEMLSLEHTGDSLRERAARSLVRHFRVWANQTNDQLLPRLERELRHISEPQ